MPHRKVWFQLRKSKTPELPEAAQPASEGDEVEEEVSMEQENGAISQVQVV